MRAKQSKTSSKNLFNMTPMSDEEHEKYEIDGPGNKEEVLKVLSETGIYSTPDYGFCKTYPTHCYVKGGRVYKYDTKSFGKGKKSKKSRKSRKSKKRTK